MQHVIEKKQASEDELRENYTKLIEALDLIKLNYANETVVKQSNSANFTHLIDNKLVPIFERYEALMGKSQGDELMKSLKRINGLSAILEEKEESKNTEETEPKLPTVSFNNADENGRAENNSKLSNFASNNGYSHFDRPLKDIMGNEITSFIARDSVLQQSRTGADPMPYSKEEPPGGYMKQDARSELDIQSRYNIFNIKHCESVPVDPANAKPDDANGPNDMILLSDMKAAKDSKAYFEETESSGEDDKPVETVDRRLSFEKPHGLSKVVGSDGKKIFLKGFVQSSIQKTRPHKHFKEARSRSAVKLKTQETSESPSKKNGLSVNLKKEQTKAVKAKLTKSQLGKSKTSAKPSTRPKAVKQDKKRPRDLTPKVKGLPKGNPTTKTAVKPKPKAKPVKKVKDKELTFSKVGKSTGNFVLVENSQMPKVERNIIESSFFHDSIMKSSKHAEQDTDSKTNHDTSLATKQSNETKGGASKLNIQILRNSNSKIRIKEGVNEKNEKCVYIDVTSDNEDGREIELHSEAYSINTLTKNTERSTGIKTPNKKA